MNEPFSGWREGLPYYAPVLAVGLLLTLGLSGTFLGFFAWMVLALGVGMALFFRDFPRDIPADPRAVVSPADGTIVAIEDFEDSPHYAGPCRRISIFLSVFSAHVNRAPYEGTVRDIRYLPGAFRNAMSPESSQVNESNAIWMETAQGPVTVRQISGAVARRIVCPVAAGAKLAKGEKFGMIRFGSRTELYLPRGTHVCVRLRDKVYAGSSIVAHFERSTISE